MIRAPTFIESSRVQAVQQSLEAEDSYSLLLGALEQCKNLGLRVRVKSISAQSILKPRR